MTVHFRSLPDNRVAALRAGATDDYGLAVERAVSNGSGNPCRCCLSDVPQDAEMLILAHRPFDALHPYAETGPIFLCAECESRPDGPVMPPSVAERTEFLVKAYDVNERIRYGSGQITPTASLTEYCEQLLSDPATATVHLRSATNNCFICRVDRA